MAGSRSRNLQWADVRDWLNAQWLIGADVSANRIVNALGGSTATAQKFLDAWRSEKQSAAAQYPMPPELTAKFLAVMGEAYRGLKDTANEELSQSQTEWTQREVVWSREEERYQSELSAKDRALEAAEAQLQASREESRRLRGELAERKAEVDSLKETVLSLNESVKTHKQHTAEALKAAEREEDRLMVQLDMERTDKRKAQQDLAKGLESIRKQAADQAREAESRLEATRQERDEATQALAVAEATAQSQAAFHTAQTDSLEKQLGAMQEEAAALRRELDESVATAKAQAVSEYQQTLEQMRERIAEQKSIIDSFLKRSENQNSEQ